MKLFYNKGDLVGGHLFFIEDVKMVKTYGGHKRSERWVRVRLQI